ncbi:hypothetical protein CCHL11_01594 [Colletotrichum chlorophyti]|uniref:Gastric mucin-like protein n=1 Tax=Colletotrichum chlorophyti TaxID=708187 RepID=A0A1Q8RYM7_9PEZI|nr:hypothetical protein CCHL11_01594 [Colletotrichum chlorophyti]
MAESAEYHGGLVAFEGPGDIVSTQLRLLPTSSQIIILPSVKEFLEPEDPDEPFESRKFIRRVHNAVVKRREAALAFLKESTPKRKRLVFLNGGTPSAQTVCIRAISRNETNGDISQAEAIFKDLVKEGVAGLEPPSLSRSGSFLDTSEALCDEDPITRAMRAADALDKETENLQLSSDIDLTVTSGRPRSTSLPLYNFSDRFGDTAPFYVFGGPPHEESAEDDGPTHVDQRRAQTPRLAITNFDELERLTGGGLDHGGMPLTPAVPLTPSFARETCDREEVFPPSPYTSAMLDVASTGSDVFSIRSTEPIFIEQASLVRMKSSASKKGLRRSQSTDQLRRSNSRYRDTLVRLKPKEEAIIDILADDGRASVIELIEDAERGESKGKVVDGPKAVYVKPSRTNKALPPVPHSPQSSEKRENSNSTYVDRGTDAEEVIPKDTSFHPVLPFSEDLVIHFKDENPDPILDYMIKAFKEGVYPITLPSSRMSVAETGDEVEVEVERSFSGRHTPIQEESEPQASPSPPPPGATVDDDYDPFSYEAPTMTTSALPTPAHTPPPTVSEPEDKFHDFNAAHSKTAVAMQNSLRSVLNIYFPPKAREFSQFSFPLLPEMDRLWKPVFRDVEPDGIPRKGSHKVDQILAIGSQRGVKRTFLSGVTSQLERLGSKSNGVSRTGRLDFRYLIATAMQSFTAQPLANQTQDNPFTNSYLLATLIIPHLETYFSAHSGVRFLLLEYPPDHLATVLALQKLVGVDLLKVAQVLDANAKGPLPFTHARGSSLGVVSTRSNPASATSSLHSKASKSATSATSPEGLAVSKVNLLITSNATEAEIATFISTIAKILGNISKFYLPEEKPKPEEIKVRRRSGNFSAFPPFTKSAMSPPMSPPSSSGRKHTRTSSSIKTSGRPPSVADTILSRRSKSRRSEKKTLGDSASFLTVEMDLESDLDLEARRLMPMFLKKNQSRKGNSRKALKFLGLA